MTTVKYALVDSPFGTLLAARGDQGLVRLAFPEEGTDPVLHELRDWFGEVPKKNALDDERRELDEYFDGNRTRFELPVDMTMSANGFSRKVLAATGKIPYGSVSTYRDVAAKAGNARAARAAGNALRQNPVPIVVPCHRVLRTGGALGGYGGGLDVKRWLLDLERGERLF
jgi:methylated-DNA-[protein]-cysteine S-methyltransferase